MKFTDAEREYMGLKEGEDLFERKDEGDEWREEFADEEYSQAKLDDENGDVNWEDYEEMDIDDDDAWDELEAGLEPEEGDTELGGGGAESSEEEIVDAIYELQSELDVPDATFKNALSTVLDGEEEAGFEDIDTMGDEDEEFLDVPDVDDADISDEYDEDEEELD